MLSPKEVEAGDASNRGETKPNAVGGIERRLLCSWREAMRVANERDEDSTDEELDISRLSSGQSRAAGVEGER